jgi:hypothetical protein
MVGIFAVLCTQASTPTTTKLTNLTNQELGGLEKRGRMGGNGEGNGESSTHQECRNNFQSTRKMGQNGSKWEKNGRKMERIPHVS